MNKLDRLYLEVKDHTLSLKTLALMGERVYHEDTDEVPCLACGFIELYENRG